MGRDVFISYKSEEFDITLLLYENLKKNDISA